MRFVLAAGLLLAAAAHASAQASVAGFASTLPAAVGDVSRWQVITGDFETAHLRGSYRFYVNPAREAMYQLMRYRVEVVGQSGGELPRATGERLAFVRHPGAPEPILIWSSDATGAGRAWRPVATDTDEYKVELGVLMAVLSVHRAARTGASP